MHDLLDKAMLECWRHFVLACRVLLINTFSVSSIKLGDALLLHFCKRTETLFGKTLITPNMHIGSAWKIMVPYTHFGALALNSIMKYWVQYQTTTRQLKST